MIFRKAETIFGVLDHPKDGQMLEGTVQIRGWAISRVRQPLDIEISVDGAVVEARVHRTRREDVLEVHGKFERHNPAPGYLAEISTHAFPAGGHTIAVRARGRREHKLLGQVNVHISEEKAGEAPPDPLYRQSAGLLEQPGRLLLVHVPKTAGTSLTAYLAAQYDDAQTLLHAENRVLGRSRAEIGRLDEFALITAHLKLDTIQHFLDTRRYFTVSVFRDPVRQLASHLAWVKRLADPAQRAELAKAPEYIRRAVERMERLDLVEFLDTMDAGERNLFDNCQIRYLLAQHTVDLDESRLLEALQRMATLDLVGTTERLFELLLVLSFSMGWDPPPRTPRLNTGKKTYFFDFDSAGPALKERIERLTRLDQVVYDHAQILFEARFRGMVKVVGKGALQKEGALSPTVLAESITRHNQRESRPPA